MKNWVGIALFALLATASSAQSQTDGTRAELYNRFFFPNGTPQNYLDVAVKPLPKLRQLLTVMPGVLDRAGGAGGLTQLTSTALQGLCESGFSLAVYAYATPFTPIAPIRCTNKLTGQPNTLEYIAGTASQAAFKSAVMNRIKQVVDDPSRGPVLVHCWNGFHASGEIAAVALRQFCGWDGADATEYWIRHAGGYPPISRVRNFLPDPSISMSPKEKAALCGQMD